MDAPTPKPRRSPATIRSLVLQSARELFAEQEYAQVSTREVARRAGVTQAQVFRHFGSKATLFVEAAYLPFHDFVLGYVRRWGEQGHGTGTSAHDTELFVQGLYELLLDNRGLLGTMSGSAGGEAPELAAATAAFLREVLGRLAGEVLLENQARGSKTMDPAYAVRFAFALVFGVAVLDHALFPEDGLPGGQPGRDVIVAEMSGFILRGASIPPP